MEKTMAPEEKHEEHEDLYAICREARTAAKRAAKLAEDACRHTSSGTESVRDDLSVVVTFSILTAVASGFSAVAVAFMWFCKIYG